MHKSDARSGAMHQNEPAIIRQNPLPIQDAAAQKRAFSGIFWGNGDNAPPIDAMNVPERPAHMTDRRSPTEKTYRPVGGRAFKAGSGARPARIAARMAASSASADTTAWPIAFSNTRRSTPPLTFLS